MNSLIDELTTLVSAPVSSTATVSRPSPIATTSAVETAIDQAPLTTVPLFPFVSKVLPLLNTRVTLLPVWPVPVILNPPDASVALINSSEVTAAIVGAVPRSAIRSGILG